MSFINTIPIEKTTASETYCKIPERMILLPTGLKKTRLKFELPTNDSSTQAAANVYVEVIGKGFLENSKSFILSILSFMHIKYLKTTHRGKTIYININSLSNRLGIKINKAYSDEILHSKIEKQFETVRETEKKIDRFFQEIIKTRYTENGDRLETANGEPISKAYFRKLLGLVAFSQFHTKKQEASYSLKDGNILFLKKEESKEWPLITLFTKKVLGEGSFGKVLNVQELSTGRTSVAKISHVSYFDEDIRNEHLILNKIFHDNNPIGIQQKPYSLFNFKLSDINYCGYIAPKYDSSLNNVIGQLAIEEKIEAARQLLKGLKELENQEISHGDIKEANCLFRRKNDDSIECVIADFGGATDLSMRAKWSYGTLFYQSEQDRVAFESLHKQINSKKTKEKKAKFYRDLKTILLRRDVYAMGITLVRLLGNSKPDILTRPELCSLLQKMVRISWEKRISASEALIEFEKIFPFA